MSLKDMSNEVFVRKYISLNVYHGSFGDENKDIHCDDVKAELLSRLSVGEKAIKEVDVLKGCRDHWQASYIDVRRKFLSEKAEVKRLNALRFESGKMVAEAIKQSEALQCCGNFQKKHDKMACPEYDYEETNPICSGGCCDKWKSDHLTRTERGIK